eukprot:790121-Amorphochlora_amoeboformis.AAC.2
MAAAGRRRLRILTALGLATVLLSLPERQVSLRSVPKARHHGTEDCRQLVDQIPEPKDTPERRAQLKEMGNTLDVQISLANTKLYTCVKRV